MDSSKVAEAYWGTAKAGGPRPVVDVANLGPPPRTLERPVLDYIRKATRSSTWLWGTLAILFGAGDLNVLWAMPFSLGLLLRLLFVPLAFAGVAVYTGTRVRKRRAELRRVLTTGQVLPAEVQSIRAVQIRGRYGRVVRVRYHVQLLVESRSIELVSYHSGLSLLQVGLVEPVVWLPELPDVIVPTYLLVS